MTSRRDEILGTFGTDADPGGLTWIMAGAEVSFHPSIGVRFKKQIDHVSRFGVGYHKLNNQIQIYDLPDRTVFLNNFGRSSVSYPSMAPFDPRDFDVVHELDPFCEEGSINRQVGIILSSAAYGIRKNQRTNWAKTSGLVHMTDSGGYQLRVRTVDYLDPKAVIEWQNQTSDYALILDAPPREGTDFGQKDIFSTLSHLQSQFADCYTANMRPDLKVFNIVHSCTPDDQRRWIDVVDRPQFFGWASAGSGDSQDFASALRGALLVATEREAKWVHVLGVSGIKIMPAMAWFAKRMEIRVTCDSSSQFLGVGHRKILIQHPSGYISTDRIGTEFHLDGKTKKNNHGVPLNDFAHMGRLPTTCACPVCSSLGFMDPFWSENTKIGPYLAIHNIWALNNFTNLLHETAKKSDYEDYYQWVKKTFGTSSAKLVAYVEHTIEYGVDAGFQEFRSLYYAETRKKSSLKPDIVFSEDRDLMDEDGDPVMTGVREGSNLELMPLYMNMDDPAVLGQFPPLVQNWWKEVKNNKGYLAYIQDLRATATGKLSTKHKFSKREVEKKRGRTGRGKGNAKVQKTLQQKAKKIWLKQAEKQRIKEQQKCMKKPALTEPVRAVPPLKVKSPEI